jgi:hypothetical protein
MTHSDPDRVLSLPDLWRPRPARLFIDVQHGLCNRMRAMASAASVAAQTDRELVVIWCRDDHCDGDMADLFDYGGAVIEDRAEADLCRALCAQVYNYMEIEPDAQFEEPILPDPAAFAGADVYIRSAYILTGPQRHLATEQQFLHALRPAHAVRDLIHSVPRHSQVACHVRISTGAGYEHLSYEGAHNWPAARHDELTHWRRQSQPDRFMARLDQLIDAGRADSVFLAADLPETYESFAQRYGARLVTLPRPVFDRSAVQLQYALADLMLLTTPDLFLASSWSSFSDVAQRLAHPGRPIEKSGRDF